MEKSKLGKNLLYNLGYQILVLILPLITSPYISRVIGAEGLGTFSYVSSVAYYFFIFINLGLANYGNRAIAQNRDDKEKTSATFCSVQAMHMFIGIPLTLFYIASCFFFYDGAYTSYFLVYGLYVVSAVFDINWFYFGIGNFKLSVVIHTITRVSSFAAMLIFVKKTDDLIIYLLIVALSNFFASAFLWIPLGKHICIVAPKFKEVVSHILPNLILFVPIFAMSIYRVMDKMMITWFSGEVQTGYYQNADVIISMSLTVFSAVATVMLPEISHLAAKKEMDSIKRSVKIMMEIGLGLAVGITFGLAAIGRKFAPIFWGDGFAESGVLIVGLAAVPIIAEWKNVLRSQYLIPCGKDKGYAMSLVYGALVNVVFNLIFIPKYGAMGAVYGTIAAEFTGAFYQTHIIRKELPIGQYITDSLIFLAPGVLMYSLVFYTNDIFPNTFLGLIYGIVLGAGVYLVLTALIFYLCKRPQFDYYVNIIKRRRS